MSKTKDKEDKQPDTNEATKNLLGALLKGYSDTHFNFVKRQETRIPSGSLILDSHIQVKSGQILRMGGPAEVGKTSQSLLFANNYMKAVPKSKTIYVNAEAKFGREIQDRMGYKFTMNHEEWDYNTIFIYQTNDFNTICDTLKPLLLNMAEKGERLCIIIDSVDMLKLQDTKDKEIGKNKRPAGVNWLTKEMLRQLGQQIQAYDALLIMITQYAATFTADQYAAADPHMMGGNNTHALNHECTYALYYRQRGYKDYITEKGEDTAPDPEKNKILGVYAKVDIKKSATNETGYTLKIPIKKAKIGNSIWVEKELVDVMLTLGLIQKNSSWFNFAPNIMADAKTAKIEVKEKFQGLNTIYDYLEANAPITQWLFDKIINVIG